MRPIWEFESKVRSLQMQIIRIRNLSLLLVALDTQASCTMFVKNANMTLASCLCHRRAIHCPIARKVVHQAAKEIFWHESTNTSCMAPLTVCARFRIHRSQHFCYDDLVNQKASASLYKKLAFVCYHTRPNYSFSRLCRAIFKPPR